MILKETQIKDVGQILRVRNSVNENKLSDPNSITEKDVEEFLVEKGKGWICEIKNEIVGFAIVTPKEHNIWALFVEPVHEGSGIGRRLHDMM